MSRRFVELVVRARRLVAPVPARLAPGRGRVTARRQVGGELTQFSFRLAFVIDLVYVGVGAMGGAALGRAVVDPTAVPAIAGPHCSRDSLTTPRSVEPGVSR